MLKKVLASTKFNLFLVLRDTKIGIIVTCLAEKVLVDTTFCLILVFEDTKLIR